MLVRRPLRPAPRPRCRPLRAQPPRAQCASLLANLRRAVLIRCATSGRSNPPPSATRHLFSKKIPGRAASTWTVNEAALQSLGTPSFDPSRS